jgi:hypothetical protein
VSPVNSLGDAVLLWRLRCRELTLDAVLPRDLFEISELNAPQMLVSSTLTLPADRASTSAFRPSIWATRRSSAGGTMYLIYRVVLSTMMRQYFIFEADMRHDLAELLVPGCSKLFRGDLDQTEPLGA